MAMDAEQRSQVIAAIELLAEEAGGSLDKKPNVVDVEAQVGFDINAADRDEAWEAYQSAGDDPVPANPAPSDPSTPEPAPVVEEEPEAPEPPATPEGVDVTNRHSGPLRVFGVLIEPGETQAVPGFDPEHAVMRAWLAAGVIDAG